MIRSILKKFGLTNAVIFLTVISTILSILITYILNFALFDAAPGPGGFFVAVITPIMIAPVLSFITLRLLVDLIDTQEKLHQLSITDDLTQAYNRRYFYAEAAAELVRQKRYGGHTSIMIFDLDNFKDTNDNHGHLAGDDILFQVSRLVQSQLRETDILALFGGDEFILLMPHTDPGSLKSIAERLRNTVADTAFHHDGIEHHNTISIGAVTINDPSIDLNHAIKKADQALYAAKHSGGNCFVEGSI